MPRLTLICVGLIFVSGNALAAAPERAQSADAFVDSVGINLHLHNADTAYADFPRVQQALQNLGIRHVRDGLIDTSWTQYYDRHNALGRAGIKSTFITSIDQSSALWLDYPRRMKDSFEAYEAPNEYDQSHDEHWPATLQSFLVRLNHTVKSDPATSRFPVVGPSLTQSESFSKLRGLCVVDYLNLHNYFAGRNPGTGGWGAKGYGSIPWNLGNVGAVCAGKPVITTETGYQTGYKTGDQTRYKTGLISDQSIPEQVAAKYVPRVFLEQWLHGIRRTYLYELIDPPSGRSTADSGFGLLRQDYSLKPAYSALRSLLHLLADPVSADSVLGDTRPAFVPQELNFKLAGDLSHLHHLLLQKRNGVFYLVLWLEKPTYDVANKKLTPVPPHSIALQTDSRVTMTQQTLDDAGNWQLVILGTVANHDLEVSDSVTVIEIEEPRSDKSPNL